MEYKRPQLLRMAAQKGIPNYKRLTSRQLVDWLLLIQPLPLPILDPAVYRLTRPQIVKRKWLPASLSWYFSLIHAKIGRVPMEAAICQFHNAGFEVAISRPHEGDIICLVFGGYNHLFFVYNDRMGQSWLAAIDARGFLPEEASFFLQYWGITTRSALESIYNYPFQGLIIDGVPRPFPL